MFNFHPNFRNNYFSKITTIEQAYWLGFLYADGFISLEHKKSGDYYRMGLALSISDKDTIDNFCDDIGLNKEYIKPYNAICQYTDTMSYMLKIRWGDQNFAQDLINLGMGYEYDQGKGKRVKIPKLPDLVTHDLMLAFLLGYYDGDGNLNKYCQGKRDYFKASISSSNRAFLMEIKAYFGLDSVIGEDKIIKFNPVTEKWVKSRHYRLTLDIGLFRDILSVYSNSLDRKRVNLNDFEKHGITPQRIWLMDNLPESIIRELFQVLSPTLIAKLLGFSEGATITRFARDEYGINPMKREFYLSIAKSIHFQGKQSPYYENYIYWRRFLGSKSVYRLS